MIKADIGIIGLAVMGENLVLNFENKGYTIAVYNRSVSKVDEFISEKGKGKNIIGTRSIETFVATLNSPRIILMMVKAGKPVDILIEQLLPYLKRGDVLIDGGNSFFKDTMRRVQYVESKGFLYVGCGVSGGEEGALHGPSLMPGGSSDAWKIIKPMFQSIAAKVDDGSFCCEWVGDNGAGHFVKMVHNGIEYGDMQLICESYDILKRLLRLNVKEMHHVFKEWNRGELDSYLIEITRDILDFYDEDTTPILDKIVDKAGQKGTGTWSGISALEMGTPLTIIGEAVFARFLSSMKEERLDASKQYASKKETFISDASFINDIGHALLASKILSYAQGFALIKAASETFSWNINYGDIALMWRGGCIIRSVFLQKISDAFQNNHSLSNLLLAPYFKAKIQATQDGWRKVVSTALIHGIPVPAMASALCYFDGYRAENLPANLLQAQRDYFGAHRYERIDKTPGELFHTDWTGHGGKTASSSYNE